MLKPKSESSGMCILKSLTGDSNGLLWLQIIVLGNTICLRKGVKTLTREISENLNLRFNKKGYWDARYD